MKHNLIISGLGIDLTETGDIGCPNVFLVLELKGHAGLNLSIFLNTVKFDGVAICNWVAIKLSVVEPFHADVALD